MKRKQLEDEIDTMIAEMSPVMAAAEKRVRACPGTVQDRFRLMLAQSAALMAQATWMTAQCLTGFDATSARHIKTELIELGRLAKARVEKAVGTAGYDAAAEGKPS